MTNGESVEAIVAALEDREIVPRPPAGQRRRVELLVGLVRRWWSSPECDGRESIARWELLPPLGSIPGIAKEQATITVDRAKLTEARAMLGVPSASAAIDVALSESVRRHRVLNDVKAYTDTPPTVEDVALGSVSPDWRDLADDIDWDAEWPQDS